VKILAVDTALGACSAALLDKGRVLAHRHLAMDRGHAEALAPMVEEIMAEAGASFAAIDRLGVTTGPGTFTGQRVGLAFMRGLRIALGVPLIGVTTLRAMAEQAKEEVGVTRAVALHDAKRDEVYIEIENALEPSVLLFASALDLLRNIPADPPVALAGTAASRACDALANKFLLSGIRQPDARFVARLASDAAPTREAPRPLYLRAPDAKLPATRT